MRQTIGYVAVVVEDYDESSKFYVGTLGFNDVLAVYFCNLDP